MKFFRRVMRTVWVSAVLSAALAGVAAWADLRVDQANALLAKVGAGDKTALETLMTEARQGNAYAQSDLGIAYLSGKGVPRDYGQAAQWFRKAAEQGDDVAQYSLGLLYAKGQGVPQDYSQAARWYRKAAEQENAIAQFSLGNFYAAGLGVPQNDSQAVRWYRKAAEQGSIEAQFNLGLGYAHGQGVPQDYGQAVRWYRKAAGQGDANALNNLGVLYANGQGVSRNTVVAYALYNLSAGQNTSSDDPAVNNRSSLAGGMTVQEVEAGQTLTRKMISMIRTDNDLLQPLDQYLAHPAVKERNQRAAVAMPDWSASGYPARPAKKPGVVSCNTHCFSGECYRTYDSGRHVHFQAPYKWNPLSGRMELDSGSC